MRVLLVLLACVAVAEAQPKTGYLSLDSNPVAAIEIDGKKLGNTPLLKFALTAGRHVIRAVRENGDTQRIQLDVVGGATLEYRLNWDGSDPADVNGYLTVFSTPAARIWVDGMDTGLTTPVKSLALKPGRRKITFVVGGDRYTFSTNIVAGQAVTMTKVF